MSSAKMPAILRGFIVLTHNKLDGCALSTMGTDALVLKPQTISVHSAD